MRQKIVAGNWKMNKTLPQGVELAKELQQNLITKRVNCQVILAPPYIHLAPIASILQPNSPIALSSQNIADHDKGAYTGEVSAEMIASIGCKYTIIGHSERRTYYGETNETLSQKVQLALANHLTPIFCVGEQLQDREDGHHYDVISKQLQESLFSLDPPSFDGIIIAYEPIWAIGTGKTATPEEAESMHRHIREQIALKYGDGIAKRISILYGGSCNASNAKELFAKENIDGGLIGGAALSVDKFLPIIEAFN